MLCPKCGMELQENVKFCPKCGEKLEQPPVVKVQESNVITKEENEIWPEWQLEEKPIGKGSYGAVYKAIRKDNNVESHAAIKIISIPLDSSEVDSLRSEGLDMSATRTYLQGIVSDFVSEIQLMESLKGVQNIVSVEDYKVVEKKDEIGWDIYIRMELLTPFNTYIRDHKMTEEDVVKLGCDICTALEICNKRNIIHRDIKPENIFINDFGHFKLGDFGIARKMENVTGGLSQKGTFNYMAPEVTTNNGYDSRVDTYSLGIVLYRLLNGNRLPFLDNEQQLLNPNERRNAVDRRIRGEELPAPCDASKEMAAVILRACAFDPNARFSSATEMKQALLSVANGTYQMGTIHLDGTPSVRKESDDLDKTTSVRKAPGDLDKTTSVRKAPVVSEKKSAPAVDTFGAKPKKKKKKGGTILAILLVVILLLGAGILLAPELLNGVGGSTASSVDKDVYDKSERKEIDAIISDAESYAEDEDYESALGEISDGLKLYPESEALQTKSEEYTAIINAQIKKDILAEAETLANAGDYAAAMKMVKDAQMTYGDDEDCQAAYETYSASHNAKVKADAITKAESLAQQNNHLGAYEAIEQAIDTVGEDAELTEKSATYENAYVTEVITQVDAALAENNVANAKTLLQNAAREVPDNETIKARLEEVNNYKSVAIDSLTPINGGFTWNEGVPADPFESDYSGVNNYAIMHNHGYGEDVYSEEYKIDGKYNFLTLTISPYSDLAQNRMAYVQVYVDSTLKYTSPIVFRKTQPQTTSVDVSGATYVKIVVHVGYGNGCVMLSDVTLSCVPNYVNAQADEYISLSTLDGFDGSLPWNSEYPENMHGSDYTQSANYATFHSHGYNTITTHGEYYVNKNYTSFSLDIAPASDFDSSNSAYVKIYLDDVLAYTSPAITQKTQLFNTGNIDISNATYLKVEITVKPDSCVVISNALLENK